MTLDTGLIIIVILILGIIVYVRLVIGRQKAVWRQFAHRHGLEYEDPGFLRYPVVRGTMQGRKFGLNVELVEMFSIRTGRSFMEMSLEVKGQFFFSMEIIKHDTFPELQYTNPGPRVRIGDPSFDDISEVFCSDESACSTYLAPRRKTVLRDLFSLEGESRLSIANQGSRIVFRSKRMIRNAQHLDHVFHTLLRVAPELDS